MTDSAPSIAPPAPLTDAERAWLQARVAALPAGAEVHPAPLSAGVDGRIVLSTDAAASALAPLAGEGGVATFVAEQAHLGAGEALVVASPGREPVRVVLGRLRAEDGGRVVVETPVELSAATAALAPGSVVELIGRPGRGGNPGAAGSHGTPRRPPGSPGGSGGPGGRGEDGPGGILWFGDIRDTLTVIAGGGSGGDGGHGGPGGDDGMESGSRGAAGGSGGNGGDGGQGGTVVISFGRLAAGAAIHPRAQLGAGGRGGEPGPGGRGSERGFPGSPGRPGSSGELAAFSIRHDPREWAS